MRGRSNSPVTEHDDEMLEQCPVCGDPYLNLYDAMPPDVDSSDACRDDEGVYVHEREADS